MEGNNYKKLFIATISLMIIGILFFANKLGIKYSVTAMILAFSLGIITLAYKQYIRGLYNTLKLIHRRYRVAIQAANGAVWEWNDKNKKLFISSRIKEVLECENNINSFEDLLDYVHKEDKENVKIFFNKMVSDREENEDGIELRLVSTTGNIFVMEAKGKVEIIKGVLWIRGIVIDITEKKKIQTDMLDKEKRYRIALEATMDVMYYIDIDKKEIYLSKELIGSDNEINKNPLQIPLDEWTKKIIAQDRKVFFNKMQKIISGENDYFNLDFRIEDEKHNLIWISSRGKVVNEEGNLLIYGALRDISDSKEKEIKINFMNYYDETTGVPNKRYFIENVSEVIRISKELNEEVAIIFVDLDNFKYINDTYGHQAGDRLLSEFCRNLYKELNHKSILARFGGDEFVIALREISDEDSIRSFVDNLIKAFNEPIKMEDKDIFCSVSIGVSLLSRDGDKIESLLKKADMAMYKAKALGKNQYQLFSEDILTTLNRRFQITEGLRSAIHKEEIYLMLQPKVDAQTERIVGYECLARWENEKFGFVPPYEFIEIAESTGFIIDLGKYLIKDAFKKCKELTKNNNEDLKLAINLSEVQLREHDIVDFIKDQLEFYELDSKHIEFEITESVIMESTSNNINTLIKLKDLGVSIALDDFGTGYSSLNYLKILPIDVLKIDKSFIDDVLNDCRSELIIEKIIEISHAFGLKVVAEGVETQEQLNYLKNKGCDLIQGYYYSRPLKYDDVKKRNIILKS